MPRRHKFTETALVVRLQQGDKDAFHYLFGFYRKGLIRVIQPIVNDVNDAEDVLQDTYMKVWLRFHYYDAQQGTLFTWLRNVARNTALDARRQRKPDYSSLESEAAQLPSLANYETASDVIGIEHLVYQRLSAHHSQVIRLAYWQGFTHQEIAEELAVPLGTVKSWIVQSLRQLRPLLRERV